MKNQKGFSLIELLVVVIIIAIIAAIAIPNLLASRKSAVEAAAISALRTIHTANSTYQATAGGNTYYANALADLGTAANGSLIDTTLAGGTKGTYTFTYSGTTATNPVGFCVTAQPAVGSVGVRKFAIASEGVIYTSDVAGSAGSTPACATGALSGGTVLGN